MSEAVSGYSPVERDASPILLVGHSHIGSIKLALAACPDPAIALVNFHDLDDSALVENRGPSAKLRERYAPRHLFSMIGGNTFHRLALLDHPWPIQVLQSANDRDLDPDRFLISNAMMRDLLRRFAALHFAMMLRLQQIFEMPLVHVAPPPPLRLDDLRGLLPPTYAGRDDYGVVPPVMRMKIYRIHCALLREHCAENAITLIEPPAAACDEDGFLLAELRDDAVHANGLYGAMVVQQLMNSVGG